MDRLLLLLMRATKLIAPCKGIQIPESVNFLLVESGIQHLLFCCVIWNSAVGIWNPINCRNSGTQ